MDDLWLNVLRIAVFTMSIWLIWRVAKTGWGVIKAYRAKELQRHHIMANVWALVAYFGFFIVIALGVYLFEIPL